jgi:hypothetical protein
MNRSFGGRLKKWLLPDPQTVPDPFNGLGAVPIVEAQPRSRVTIAGRAHQLRTNPATGWFEANLEDATGTVRLVWMGRATVDCLHEGALLTAKGRIATEGQDLVIFNPDFAVLPD